MGSKYIYIYIYTYIYIYIYIYIYTHVETELWEGSFNRFRTELWALGQVWVVVVGSLDRVVGSFTLWADNVNSYLIFPQLGWIGCIYIYIYIYIYTCTYFIHTYTICMPC